MKNFEVYTGGLTENEFLGHPERPKRGESDSEQLKYLPYQEAVEIVRATQTSDPTDPAPRRANDLHAAVAERLDLDNYSELEFFSAVRTSLDRHHGVDAFFVLHLPDNNEVTVTADLSLQEKDIIKADVLLYVPNEDALDYEKHKDDYQRMIDRMAGDIVGCFRDRLAAATAERKIA